MHIIGITGTIGAGKGTVAEYLTTKGFKYYSARALFLEEMKKRGVPLDRDSMRFVSNDLRKMYGPGYVAETLFKKAEAEGGDAVIESIRTLGEVQALRQLSTKFILLAVDADPKLRYERAHKRGSETDDITFEHFMEQERLESETTDPWKQNLPECIAQADAVIMNNGSLEDLHKATDKALEKLG